MLVANSLDFEHRKHFDNDRRGPSAAFGIQNVAEIGLKDFGVYPGQWYGIHSMS